MPRRRTPTTTPQPDADTNASGGLRGGGESHGVGKKNQSAKAKAHNDALHLQTISKREEALALRGKGMSYEAIGRKLGVVTKTAYEYVQEALNERKERLSESAEQLRQMMHARLDAQYEKLVGKYSGAGEEHIASISNALVKIEERRAKLDGLDAPAKVEMSWQQELKDAGIDPEQAVATLATALEKQAMNHD